MTLVGKILVIVIMFFSVVFLGISTVVFTTATDWKKANDNQVKKVKELTAKNQDYQAQVDAAKKDLDKAKSDHTTAIAALEKRSTALDDEIKRTQAEITDARTKLETVAQSANTALAEAKQRLEETLLLREQKAAVEKQANEYKVRQTDLNDKIRELERLNATLDANTTDLRDRVARYSTLLRRNGLNDNIANIKGVAEPADVEGEVSQVDAKNQKVVLTIGADDGLHPGNELDLFRLKPSGKYLGKIRIISTDPNQSVGKVIGTTIQGMKIKEGDHVSSKIRSR